MIEMLAGLTIAVAILAVLAQFTSQTLRNWNRGETSIAVMEMLTSGLARLRTDLALALPMRPPGTDSASVMFAGDARQLLFVAATGFGAGDRGLELISVTVTNEGDGIAVVRQRGPVMTGPAPLRDPVILLRGRLLMQFTYRDDDGQALVSWTNRDKLPKGVAVDVRNQAGVSVFPVPFVVRLPTTMPAACLAGAEDAPGGCPGGQARTPPRQDAQQNPQNPQNRSR
jgi:general secretion pathway protein J